MKTVLIGKNNSAFKSDNWQEYAGIANWYIPPQTAYFSLYLTKGHILVCFFLFLFDIFFFFF